jgi:hypothetical protein
MEGLRAGMSNSFQDLTEQLRQSLAEPPPNQNEQPTAPQDDPPQEDIQWTPIMDEFPTAPTINNASWPNIFKLVREVKRRAALMTADRDLHDIHTVLFLVVHCVERATTTS